MTEEVTESNQEQVEQPAETTEQEQTEQTGSTETTEQVQRDPETVPYARFKEVYGKAKQAERDADYWRNEAQRKQTPQETTPPQTPTGKPTPEQYDDYNQYVEDLTDWKLAQRRLKDEADQEHRAAQERQGQFFTKLGEGALKYQDFEQVVYDPSVVISNPMVEALYDCDHAIDIAYHLGQNPQESRRIAALSPLQAAREIGKLEAKFSSSNPPSQKSKTNAPAPTAPVGSGETPPKKLADMSTEEFIAYRNKKEFGQ